MLRVSRLTDYATVVMTCIAAHPHDVLTAGQIADESRLELPTVSKLLKALGHASLVESFRGVNGGYRLARSATDISLAEIVEALEGPIGMTECSLAEGHCDRESQCGVRGSWQQVNSVLDSALRAVSLADMLKTRLPVVDLSNSASPKKQHPGGLPQRPSIPRLPGQTPAGSPPNEPDHD